VIKVEPPSGDHSRRLGPFPEATSPDPEQSALFLHLNTNKRSITAMADDPATDALLAGADIVILSELAQSENMLNHIGELLIDATGPGWSTIRRAIATRPGRPRAATGARATMPGP
jgi:hypothetical protein